jgi:cell wall assembly regulator SMI1
MDVSVGLVEQSWSRIERWLRAHAPDTLATLGPPADPAEITAAEEELGTSMPAELVAWFRRHDGVTEEGLQANHFLLPDGYHLMSLRRCLAHRRMLVEILDGFEDFMVGSWWHPEWLPVAQHSAGDALIVDLREGPERGRAGEFMHEDSARFDRWASFGALLAETADLLEGRRTNDGAVPRAASGRLVWGRVEPLHANPRSVLALADAAEPEPEPEPVAEPPIHRSGRYTMAVARRVEVRRPARPPQPPAEPAEWILGLGRCCLTFAKGVSEAELLARFGGDREKLTPLTSEQVATEEKSWRSGYRPRLRVGEVNGWAFGFEQGHEYGMRNETLRRLSVDTQAVSLVCNSTITEFGYADDGVVLAHFDNRWPDRLDGAAPERFRPLLEEAGLLPHDPERYVEDESLSALALAIRLGPGTFDPDVLTNPLPTGAILPLLADAPEEPQRLSPRIDPEVATAIEYATEEQLRPAVIALARRRAAALGLDVEVALAESSQGAIDNDSPLGRTLRALHAEADAVRTAWLDFGSPVREMLTEPERNTWFQRDRFASAVAELVTRPAAIAAHSLVGPPDTFAERAEFLDALAEVEAPADAASLLEQAEQDRMAQRDRLVMAMSRKSRARPSLGPAVMRRPQRFS